MGKLNDPNHEIDLDDGDGSRSDETCASCASNRLMTKRASVACAGDG